MITKQVYVSGVKTGEIEVRMVKYIYHLHINTITGGESTRLLEEYKKTLEVQNRNKNTITRYYDSAEKFLHYINDINKEEITRYLIHLNQTQKPKSIRCNIYGMNRLLNYLNKGELKAKIPRDKQLTRITIELDELNTLVQHIHDEHPFMEYLMILFIRDCLARPHEITKARWEWLNGDKILFQGCKTGDTIRYPSQELQDALQQWKNITRYPTSPYIFTHQKGKDAGRKLSDHGDTVRRFINHETISLLGRRCNPTTIRASIGTILFNNNVNPRIIQSNFGHRNLQTTLIYNYTTEKTVLEYKKNRDVFMRNNPYVI